MICVTVDKCTCVAWCGVVFCGVVWCCVVCGAHDLVGDLTSINHVYKK